MVLCRRQMILIPDALAASAAPDAQTVPIYR